MSLKKNVIANFIGQGWAALMGLAFVPLYIKYLGIEAYGLIGFYALLQAWFTLLDMGITQTLNREMARFTAGSHTAKSIHDLLRSLEIISLSIAFIISSIVYLLSNFIASNWIKTQSLNVATVENAISLMGFIIALRFMEGIYKGALLGLQKQVVTNMINIIFATLRFAGVIPILLIYESSIEVFFTWQIFCTLLSLVVFYITVYKSIPPIESVARFSKQAILEVRSFAKGMIGITFLALLLTQIDKLLLSNLITLSEYGFYTLASTIAGGLAFIAAPTSQAIYPRLVEYIAQGKSDLLARDYHLGAQLISVFIIPITVILMFYGWDAIYLWSGDQQLANATAPILLPLTLGSALNCLLWMPYQLQLAHAWTSFAIKTNTIAVIVLTPAIYFATTTFGALGAAWCWAVLNIGYITIGMHFMYKKILPEEKWSWYWNDIIKQMICSVIIVALSKAVFMGSVVIYMHAFIFLLSLSVATITVTLIASGAIRPIASAYFKRIII